LQRHQVSGSTLSVGRGYDNDVILNDPYLCARHLSLQVDEQGRWQAFDNHSVNGSFTENQKPLTNGRVIESGDVISIGKSYLRFIYPQQSVAPAIRLSGLEGLLNWLSSPMVVIAIFSIYIGMLFGNYYISSAVEIKTSQMLSSVFARFTAMSLLPLLFSLLARFFKHDARVLTQVVVWYCFFIIFLLVNGLGTLISFNSNQDWLSSGFSYVTQVGLLFSILWATFYIAFHQSPRRRTMIAGAITFGIYMLGYLYSASHSSDFNPKPMYDNTLLAPEFVISTPVTIKQFISQSESIFELTTKQASKQD
jgi:hypothetical protein